MSNQHKYNDKPYSITDKETTPIYSRWVSMNGRCRDKGHSKYNSYGGKGIKVCADWRNDFDAFREWALFSGFTPDLSLDRIDPDGDYTPNNCRWIPIEENRARARVKHGSNHYKAVLDEMMVIGAHQRRNKGESIASIARDMLVSEKTLGQALRGTTWKRIKAIVDSGVLSDD